MITVSGLKIAVAFSVCYGVASLTQYAVEKSDALIDIGLICSVVLSLALISFIVKEGKERIQEKILIISIFTSSALLIIQYVLYFNASYLVYNSLNAIIDPVLILLTVIDVAAMIWISIDKSTNRLQRRDRKLSTAYNRSIFNLQTVGQIKAGN